MSSFSHKLMDGDNYGKIVGSLYSLVGSMYIYIKNEGNGQSRKEVWEVRVYSIFVTYLLLPFIVLLTTFSDLINRVTSRTLDSTQSGLPLFSNLTYSNTLKLWSNLVWKVENFLLYKDKQFWTFIDSLFRFLSLIRFTPCFIVETIVELLRIIYGVSVPDYFRSISLWHWI